MNDIGQGIRADGVEDLAARHCKLEIRYTELLEERIALLESKLAAENPAETESIHSRPTSPAPGQPIARRETNALAEGSKYARVLFKREKRDNQNDTGEVVDSKDLPVKLLSGEGESVDAYHAFEWRQIVDSRGDEISCQITIFNVDLKKAIASQLDDYPGHWDEEQMIFHGIFRPLVYNWDRFQRLLVDGSVPEQILSDLHIMLELIKKSKRLRTYFNNLEVTKKDATITSDMLWTLFPPGELIFGSPFNEPQVFIVSDCEQPLVRFSADPIWAFLGVSCWRYDFDGEVFNRYYFRFTLPKHDGKKKINSLRCYPLKYHERESEITKQLQARGARFRNFCITKKGQQMFQYNGNVILDAISCHMYDVDVMRLGGSFQTEGTPPSQGQISSPESRRENVTGRVMIDAASYALHGPGLPLAKPEWVDQECDCLKCSGNDKLIAKLGNNYDDWRKDSSGNYPEFESKQLLICPPMLRGYALDKKKWVELLVDKVRIISEDEKRDVGAFNNIVFPREDEEKGIKKLIQSLVQNHSTGTLEKKPGVPGHLEDLIPGKGKGLVILLYGAPGTGKTLTAEGVAAFTGKPLLKVSLVDIGLDVKKVEEELETRFQLASNWEAVLLFDEADIMLEARDIEGDLKRNAMVSVFLKVLEYYEGILMLTTNRIKTFDVAVQSRVHLGIRFPDMDQREQKNIFKLFLGQISRDDVILEPIESWLKDEYDDLKFNGRQIRNIVSSAMDLARAENQKLQLKHVKKMWNCTRAFQSYLKEQTIRAKDRAE